MNKEQAIRLLADIKAGEDPETAHHVADSALIQFLRDNGHPDLAQAWTEAKNRCGFWYS